MLHLNWSERVFLWTCLSVGFCIALALVVGPVHELLYPTEFTCNRWEYYPQPLSEYSTACKCRAFEYAKAPGEVWQRAWDTRDEGCPYSRVQKKHAHDGGGSFGDWMDISLPHVACITKDMHGQGEAGCKRDKMYSASDSDGLFAADQGQCQ